MRTVLVTVDAVRPDHLAQYGYDRDTMPALDRVLDGGTHFEDAFANGPHSGVSIPSFLTSQYRGREALANGPSVATALSEAGVTTAGFHSNTMLANEVESVAGFDRFEDFDVGADEDDHERLERSLSDRLFDALTRVAAPVVGNWGPAKRLYERFASESQQFSFQAYVDAETVTDEVTAWLADHADDDFFCWVHYMDPHRPYGVDPGDPAFVDDTVDDEEIRELMIRAGNHPEEITRFERERLIDLYDSDLRYTSEHLDRLFDAVTDHCGFDETLVAVTADHGEEFREHGHFFHRNRPYDELLGVPLAVSHPEQDRERVRKQRELLDLAPTVCEFHDVSVPDAFEGRSLYAGAHRRVVASGALASQRPVAAVRTGAWKYIQTGSEAGGTDVDRELYDLDNDAAERSNVARTETGLADSLQELIPEELLVADGEMAPGEASGATRERLEQLGYLD